MTLLRRQGRKKPPKRRGLVGRGIAPKSLLGTSSFDDDAVEGVAEGAGDGGRAMAVSSTLR